LGVVVAAAGTTIAAPALAQNGGLALDRFEPAPAGDRMFGVPSPYAAGELTPHVMLLGDYAHDPLVLQRVPSDTNAGTVVGSQLYLNLDAALSLWNRILVDVDVPVAVYQSGASPTVGGESFASPSAAQFGDLRLGARVRLFGEYHNPFQIAVGAYVWLPTANKNSYVGTGDVRALPQLILGGRIAEHVVWSAAAGVELQKSSTFGGIEQGSMVRWGAGVGFLLLDNRHLQVGPEASGELVLRDVQRRSTNAELLVDLRYRVVDNVEIAAGAGPGLASGIGTPDFRALLSVAYTPEPRIARDRDRDGILDDRDACPDVKGVVDADPKKNGCPPDRDQDGIVDDADACPDVKGVVDADPKKNGCPPPADADGDGIPDEVDACPDVKGVADPDPKKNGCPAPADTDGDGIVDAEDACPTQKGPRSADPQKNGCSIVRVTANAVVITEQVQFETDNATIKPASDALLDAVASVLAAQDEIVRVEVQGHTDSKGTPAHNKHLSQARAEAVMKALVARGIAAGRLVAKGFGQDVPIADNGTDAGRQQNRRVQFAILQRKETPAP